MAVARIFPTVAVDLIRAPDASGREDDRARLEQQESPAFARVTERTGNAAVILDQGDNGRFHVHLNALMNAVILERPDHFKTRAVAHVSEPRVAMAAEVPLEDASVLRAIEH